MLTPQETDELLGHHAPAQGPGRRSSSSPTSSARSGRSPTGSPCIRRGKVVGSADPTTSRPSSPTLMVGRAVDLALDKAPAEPGGASLQVSDLTVIDAAAASTSSTASTSTSRAARSSPSPACRATARPSSSRPCSGSRTAVAGSVQLDGEELVGRSVRTPRRRRRLRPGGPRARRPHRHVHGRREPRPRPLHSAPFAKGSRMQTGRVLANAEPRIDEFDVRTRPIARSRHAVRRQPAEGRAGPRAVPAAAAAHRRAADPRRRRRLDRVHARAHRRRSATTAPRCSSSPPSSTR